MAIIGVNGIQNDESGENLYLISKTSIAAILGSSLGKDSLFVDDSFRTKVLEFSADKRYRYYGRFLDLAFNIEDDADISQAGIIVKNVANTPAEIINPTVFNSLTKTITIDSAGIIIDGDLFYVIGTRFNNGMFKAATVTPTSIVIDDVATEHNVKTMLVDETVVIGIAKISAARPRMILWDAGWKLGQYESISNWVEYLIAGIGSIENAVDFADEYPNLGCQGVTAPGSGAAKIGLFNDDMPYFPLAPNNVQDFAQNVHDNIANQVDGKYIKSGIEDITISTDTVDVTFVTDFENTIRSVLCTIEHIGGTPFHYETLLRVKALTGFTIELSASVEDANYKLHWIALGS